MSKPFFSIVVVCLNVHDLIKPTIDSVLCQTFKDYEIIVKDGLSTDDTLTHIPSDDSVKIFREKDSGIYDAMNQAISHCSGEYIFFLNCGDIFQNNHVLEDIYVCAQSCNKPAILYGNHLRGNQLFQYPLKIKAFSIYRSSICHQAFFTHRDIFEKIGKYNTEYRISADYDHTVNAFFAGFSFVYCPVTISSYLPGGVSETKKGVETRNAEYKKIRKTYFTFFQRFRYRLIIILSLGKLRRLLISPHAPAFLKKFYRFAANKIRKFL